MAMENVQVTRRKFLEFSGKVIACISQFTLSDLLSAEALAVTLPATTTIMSLCEKSAKNILEIARSADPPLAPDWALRFGIMGDATSGFKFLMGYSRPINEERDVQFRIHDVPIVIDRDSVPYLTGTNIHFVEANGKTGFAFDSPLLSFRRKEDT
jgi:Fe-S cluster assembly iron-binding protein IscA